MSSFNAIKPAPGELARAERAIHDAAMDATIPERRAARSERKQEGGGND